MMDHAVKIIKHALWKAEDNRRRAEKSPHLSDLAKLYREEEEQLQSTLWILRKQAGHIMAVDKATIVKGLPGGDKISLRAPLLPNPCPGFEDEPELHIKFETPPNKGADYLEAHFPGMEIEVIEVPKIESKFSKEAS